MVRKHAWQILTFSLCAFIAFGMKSCSTTEHHTGEILSDSTITGLSSTSIHESENKKVYRSTKTTSKHKTSTISSTSQIITSTITISNTTERTNTTRTTKATTPISKLTTSVTTTPKTTILKAKTTTIKAKLTEMTTSEDRALSSTTADDGTLGRYLSLKHKDIFLKMVNDLRKEHEQQMIARYGEGYELPPYRYSESLQEYANKRAYQLSYSFSHVIPDTGQYPDYAENINWQVKENAKAIFTGWKNSPVHYANMCSEMSNGMALGVYKAPNGRIYWALVFDHR